MLLVAAVSLLFSMCRMDSPGLEESRFSYSLDIEENENWWVGVIAESHLFPLHDESSYEFDFYGNTAGNQGQPLLISDNGRYIWNDEPFKFRFERGILSFSCDASDFQYGRAGNTLKEAYLYTSENFFPPSGKIPGEKLFTLPQFNSWIEFTYYQSQEGIMDYAHAIVANGFEPGVLMIDEGWAKHYGNWDFNPVSFPDPKGMINELKELGFTVMLWICPYYSPDGVYWKEQWLDYIEKGDTIWIVNAENPAFPAVMQWWDGHSNVIDLSNPKGWIWFIEQLDYLQTEYTIDGFKLDGGDATHYSDKRFLTEARSYKPDITPNEHSELFVRFGLEYPYNEYRAAWKMGGQPVAMRLRDKYHNWEDLQKLIPGIINQGLMGYPFNCPDMIGGGDYLSFLDPKSIDQELIVRASQCHALMPMMQFSVAPWRVLDEKNLQICVEMASLHSKMGEHILELARKSADTGEPIVRSLEYEYPENGYSNIKDQFLLGTDILVAPVLEKGAIKRRIVFPEGKWKGEDGSIVNGPVTIEVNSPLERLPWFTKVD